MRGEKKVSRNGARKTMQAKLGLDPETHDPLPSLSWGGSDECPDQPVSILETKWIRFRCKISFEGEMSFKGEIRSASRARSALSQGQDQLSFEGQISFESRQDQLHVQCEACVECKARVELWSSLLVGRFVSYNNLSNAGRLC